MRILLGHAQDTLSRKKEFQSFLQNSLSGELLLCQGRDKLLHILSAIDVDEKEYSTTGGWIEGHNFQAALRVEDGTILDFGDFLLKVDPDENWCLDLYLDVKKAYKGGDDHQFERLIVEKAIPNSLHMNDLFKIVSEDGEELCIDEAEEAVAFFKSQEKDAILENKNVYFRDDNGEWRPCHEDGIPRLYWRNKWVYAVYRYDQPLLLNPQNARL